LKIALLGHSIFSEYSFRMLKPILEDNRFELVLMIIYQPKQKSLAQKLKAHWKKGRRGYLLVLIGQILVKKIQNKIKKSDAKYYQTEIFMTEKGVSLIKTPKLYSEDIIAKIKSYKADVLVLFEYHGIVKDKLLRVFPQGVLSYHYGDMRKYRGQPAAFWELFYRESEMGVTVQLLSPGIDCGKPVEEKSFKLNPKKDSIKTISKRVEAECPEMMYKALYKIYNNEDLPQIKYGKLFTLPTLRQWILFNIKIFARKILPIG
jgi:folate-dependent phosphoribosylglycinamide formyltransferase PurN